MAKVIAEGEGWRKLDNGQYQVTKALARQLDGIVGAIAGDDDDDEMITVGGDDDDDSELGATKKNKKKNGFLAALFGNKHKDPKPPTNNNSGKTSNTTINLTGGGLPPQMDPKSDHWRPHFETSTKTLDQAGSVEITIRPQEDFWADTLICDGSSDGANITKIKFGANTIFEASGDGGADVSMFKASAPFAKEVLQGAYVRGGLDITVTGNLTGAGTLKVFFAGRKERAKSC